MEKSSCRDDFLILSAGKDNAFIGKFAGQNGIFTVGQILRDGKDIRKKESVAKRLVICDDEGWVLDKMEAYVRECYRQNRIFVSLQCFDRGKSLLYEVEDGARFDLLLLDIEMPGMDGMELASLVKKRLPDVLIIFLTSHMEYALDAMERMKDGPKEEPIRVTIRRINHFLIVEVANPCKEDGHRKKGIFGNTGISALGHGWGLRSVRQAVLKYGGSFSCSMEEGWFRATAMLFFALDEKKT